MERIPAHGKVQTAAEAPRRVAHRALFPGPTSPRFGRPVAPPAENAEPTIRALTP